MTDLQKKHYKEKSPSETVELLQSILKEHGIEVEEQWADESFINTFSLRLNFKGTTKGVNGKGVTKEYARASAYAELFERFQNGILIHPRYVPKVKTTNNYLVSADEKILTSSEIVKQDDAFMKMYFSRRNQTNLTYEEKAKAFLEINRIDYMAIGEEDRYVCLPFYDVRSKRTVYLPHRTYSMYYGSNGMAAGNSPAEAIVQALSEIFERVAQKSLFFLKGGLPDVPEKYIRQYPELFERYNKLQMLDGYDVSIKDCSFGGKFPVVGMLIIQKDTGKYGIKVGCHPDFGIALERTLTEATQGADIFEYVERSTVDFLNRNVTDRDNMGNSYTIGLAQYPYQLFSDKAAFEFTVPKNVSKLSNEQMCKSMIKGLMESGFDVLIRDVSTFGFPSYHVIVPQLSEITDASDDIIRANNTRAYTSVLLQHPESITEENCKYVIASLGFFSKSIMENTLETYYQDTTGISLPFSEIGASALYLAAMCHILCRDYKSAYKKMLRIEQHSKVEKMSAVQQTKIKAISQYLGAMVAEGKHIKAMKYMKKFFNDTICEEIDNLFCEPDKVVVKQFPKVDPSVRRPSIDTLHKYADILKAEQIRFPIDQQNMASYV